VRENLVRVSPEDRGLRRRATAGASRTTLIAAQQLVI